MGVRTSDSVENGTTDDARPSDERDLSPADPFLMGYDTSRIKLDTNAAEEIGGLLVLASRVL
ncbi:hypothetical protein [Natrialbaceae archaeon AArc-T1-2]|uniref:hypothetical protein n=1 Tax=Natrialbaceae archaeon AArc-T1-2 TaxID=3053904 RepID=UPI00255AECD5|nr:hypothetical protein [Natrialbaceae archaeon AArc-T1-2]WIV67547.1 hypothetical protein QQ977_02110 [Natrialbaceae archaeon AArc-T1-2]